MNCSKVATSQTRRLACVCVCAWVCVWGGPLGLGRARVPCVMFKHPHQGRLRGAGGPGSTAHKIQAWGAAPVTRAPASLSWPLCPVSETLRQVPGAAAVGMGWGASPEGRGNLATRPLAPPRGPAGALSPGAAAAMGRRDPPRLSALWLSSLPWQVSLREFPRRGGGYKVSRVASLGSHIPYWARWLWSPLLCNKLVQNVAT